MDPSPPRSALTTHVLDTASGLPARGMEIALTYVHNNAAEMRISGTTNDDGRCPAIYVHPNDFKAGIYKMKFFTAEYFRAQHGLSCFYPFVEVTFEVADTQLHHHVPLLISPYGYSTYRGS
eukprot:Nk52_evm10s255 gene=Nk52_evmTU10s255